ncbi:hypothetical protein [Massilia sp. TS11]|uniref:hypothetical protein n=1 Tax=Massilia sp. TS11 TaxID=2908003 RepID=UPI001EDBB31A|nr:hypothetical protein [Massilia sp. TS11]MCG2586484.1 hypothetical protein [Massilia sp. TS11]
MKMNESPNKISDGDLVRRAETAYRKAGGNQQPSDRSVEVVECRRRVTLSNVNGTLAVYEFDGKRLKRIE